MRLRIDKTSLARELALVVGAVDKRSTIPVLANVHLATSGDALVATATDLEMAVTSTITTDVHEPGATTINARRMLDYVRLLPEGDVTIETSAAHWTTLRAGKNKARIAGMSPESFPEIPAAEGEPLFSIAPYNLAAMIRQTRFAISREQSRFTIDGLRIEASATGVRMVATDSHRLARAWADVPASRQESSIVPARALGEIMKLTDAAPEGENAHVHSGVNSIHVRIGPQTLSVRRLARSFPDWTRILPAEFSGDAQFGRAALVGALERVVMFADERSSSVRITVGDGEITVSATADSGEGDESIDAVTDGHLAITISGAYMLDALRCSSAERMRVRHNGPDKAIAVEPTEDPHHSTIIMPMRA